MRLDRQECFMTRGKKEENRLAQMRQVDWFHLGAEQVGDAAKVKFEENRRTTAKHSAWRWTG